MTTIGHISVLYAALLLSEVGEAAVGYFVNRGMSPTSARRALEKLVEAGYATVKLRKIKRKWTKYYCATSILHDLVDHLERLGIAQALKRNYKQMRACAITCN